MEKRLDRRKCEHAFHTKRHKKSKLIAFHHKVVHNYVAHNANMKNEKKWNMKENENCKYCKEKETILHLYVNWPEPVKLLKQVLRALHKNYIKVIDCTLGNSNKAETLIFLIKKRLIWSYRFHGA